MFSCFNYDTFQVHLVLFFEGVPICLTLFDHLLLSTINTYIHTYIHTFDNTLKISHQTTVKNKSINCTHHLQPSKKITRQADPLNKEEVLNQRKQRKHIIQEEYYLFTYAQSYNYVKRISIDICFNHATSLTICYLNVPFDSRQINK